MAVMVGKANKVLQGGNDGGGQPGKGDVTKKKI